MYDARINHRVGLRERHAVCCCSRLHRDTPTRSQGATEEKEGVVMDGYNEQKYCDKCKRYVRYLTALNQSYCIHCDGKVTVFSKKDMKSFHKSPLIHD